MKCPHCNQEHPEGTKFCPETGQKMPIIVGCTNKDCPNYGRSNLPTHYKFCSECGSPIVSSNDTVVSQSNIRLQEDVKSCPYDKIDDFHEGYARVWIDDVGAGYIDINGKEIIKCQYTDDATDFYDGLAEIYDESTDSDMLIDRNNQTVLRVRKDLYLCGRGFSEGLCLVGKKDTYKLGFIDRNGKLVIDCQFDHANDFHDGLALVYDKEYDDDFEEYYETNFRFIDKEGDEICGGFDYATDFHDGYAVVQNKKSDGIALKTRIIDNEGYTVFNDFSDYEDSVSNGVYKHHKELNEGVFCLSDYEWVDISNRTKHYIDKHAFLKIRKGFSEGFGIIQNKQGKWGYMDVAGNRIIECQFDDAGFFSEGLAPVKQNGLWGYIDRLGKVVIPYRYTDAGRFSEGRAVVRKDNILMVIDNNPKIRN